MTSQTLLDLDPKLVFDLAARVDPLATVADRYGLDPQFLAELAESPHVNRLIKAKRKELDDAGFVLATKAKLMFEDLLPDIYRRAKGENSTLSGVLEAAKFLRTVAGLDKQDPGNLAGEKFSITIQFGGASAPASAPAQSTSTIDVTPTRVSIDLPPTPAYILGHQNQLSDLEYAAP